MHPTVNSQFAYNLVPSPPRGKLRTTLFVFTTFFLSFLPTEIIFQHLGGREIKLRFWAALIALSLVLALFRMIRGWRWNGLWVFMFISFFLFSVYSAFQAWLRPPIFSYKQTLVTIFFVPLFALMGMLSAQNKETVINTLFCLSGFYIVASLISVYGGYLSLYGSEDFQDIVPPHWYEFEEAGYQGSTMYVALFSLIFISWSWFRSKSIFTRVLVGVASMYSMFLLFILGGRSAILAFVLALFFVVLVKLVPIISTFLINKRDVFWVCAFFGGIATFWFSLLVFVARRPELLTIRRLFVLLEAGDRSERVFLFTNAINLWLQDIWTFWFGIGPQAFPQAMGYQSEGMYPHNFILESLCEYGLIGFVLLCTPMMLVALVYTKRIFTGKLRMQLSSTVLASITVLFFVISMGTGSLSSIWPLIYLISALAPIPHEVIRYHTGRRLSQ